MGIVELTVIEAVILVFGALAVGYLISYTLDYSDEQLKAEGLQEQLDTLQAENSRLTEQNTYLNARANSKQTGGYFSRTA